MSPREKNDKLAEKHRNNGNEQFTKREFEKALLFYNRSLCYAATEASQALAFANRSAACFEMGRYEKCLKNIQLARDHNYPAEKLHKLIEREEKCKKKLEEPKEELSNRIDYAKLSYPAHEKLPLVADCLQLVENEKFGKHFITTKNLKAGDVIAVYELPFRIQIPKAKLHRCGYCITNILTDGVPCSGCALSKFRNSHL